MLIELEIQFSQVKLYYELDINVGFYATYLQIISFEGLDLKDNDLEQIIMCKYEVNLLEI